MDSPLDLKNSEENSGLRQFKSVLRIHLLTLLGYSILLSAGSMMNIAFSLVFCIAILIHMLISLIMGIASGFAGNKREAFAHFLSLFLVPLIGGSSCLGVLNAAGGL